MPYYLITSDIMLTKINQNIQSLIQSLNDDHILPKSRSLLADCYLVSTGCLVLLTFAYIFDAVSDRKLAQKQLTFVQLNDGTAARIQGKNKDYRSPEVIKRFVKTWVTRIWSWSGKIPGTSKPDPGIKINSKERVPSNTWTASLMMSTEFGKETLKELAKRIPNTAYTGQSTATTYISHMSEPRQISKGVWEVDVVATRIIMNNQQGETRTRFNRTITVQATEIPLNILGQDANKIEQIVHSMRAAGLEITFVVPLEDS